MALVINNNIASLNAQRNLVTNNSRLAVSVARLSSGLRINSAKDDAAGLSISEKLRAQYRSINVAVRNAQDGISVAQTAEGGFSELGNLIGRMRELAEQAASGLLADNSSERTALNTEFSALKAEITRIATVTEFNGQKLLDGTFSVGMSVQIGIRNTANDRLTISIGSQLTVATGITSDLNTAAGAQTALGEVDTALDNVTASRGALGAIQNRFESVMANLRVAGENVAAAESAIRDTDFAYETAQFTKNQILVQAATAMVAQANVLPQAALQLLK